jgi:hypothetical protein
MWIEKSNAVIEIGNYPLLPLRGGIFYWIHKMV